MNRIAWCRDGIIVYPVNPDKPCMILLLDERPLHEFPTPAAIEHLRSMAAWRDHNVRPAHEGRGTR
jgi:hypothetical protein